jgi:hypothetical protein
MKKFQKIFLFSFLTIGINLALIFFLLFTLITPSGHINLKAEDLNEDSHYLVGTKNGIFLWEKNAVTTLWKGEVYSNTISPLGYYFITAQGIVFSKNLKDFELRNTGIHTKTIKNYKNNEVSYFKITVPLKDFSYDPYNPQNMITASQHGIYYSQDNGKSWNYLASPAKAPGIRSVAIYSFQNKLHLFFGHPFEGIYHRIITAQSLGTWQNLQNGLIQKGGYREEISNIKIDMKSLQTPPHIFVSQNFTPHIYELNLQTNTFKLIYASNTKDQVQMLESLENTPNNNLLFLLQDKVLLYSQKNKEIKEIPNIKIFVNEFAKQYGKVNTLSVFEKNQKLYSLKELWLLQDPIISQYKKKALGKQGIYMQTDALRSSKRFPSILNMIKQTHLNMVTVDMKDDFGYLRFSPKDALIKKLGSISAPIDVERSIETLHKNGIYVVARIPIFKDKRLYIYNSGEFAVKDKTTMQPWRGTKTINGTKLNSEYWVDPYNEKVWEYNIHIANELLKRGFDEVQFDYIRFPTDGKNLSNALFTYQKEGMDKESAIISFLRYARENINGSISIDIYGANGWLRTSSRTGQDVEMLSQYVDVIAPMYYPSHFAKNFLNYPPYEDRPYRIYYKGSLRNYYIARREVVIRPYVQAFMLTLNNYDKEYYGSDYINKEILGVKNSINMGFTFWNSSTKYKILLDTILNTDIKDADKE